MITRNCKVAILVMMLVTFACVQSAGLRPEDVATKEAAISTAVPALASSESSGELLPNSNAPHEVAVESVSEAARETIRDFIIKYPELHNLVVGEEGEVTVMARVLRAGSPVILIAALDEPLPVIGQVDDLVIIAILAGATVVYMAPQHRDVG